MAKKCMLCDSDAEYYIKGCSETYCKECALEQFHDLDYLQKIDGHSKEEAKPETSEEKSSPEEE